MAGAFLLEGSSMLPVFKPGESVLVSAVNDGGLRPGDCAVYSYEGQTLLHRVVRTEAGGVWMADDAGRLEAHFIQLSGVRGQVISNHPLSGGLCGLFYSKLRRAAAKIFLNA